MLIWQVRDAARYGTEKMTDDGKPLPTARKGKGRGRGRGKAKGTTDTSGQDADVDKKRKGGSETITENNEGSVPVKKNKYSDHEGGALDDSNGQPAGESEANPPTKARRNPKQKPSMDDIQTAWKEQEPNISICIYLFCVSCYIRISCGIPLKFGGKHAHQICQEKDLSSYGIPIVEGFSGMHKSYTVQPSDPTTMSSIGVL